jgi:hypothetical protein
MNIIDDIKKLDDDNDTSRVKEEHQINYSTNSVIHDLENLKFKVNDETKENFKEKKFNIRNLDQRNSKFVEKNKLFSQLDSSFVKNLIKMQNDPNLKNLLSGNNQISNKSNEMKYNKPSNDKVIIESSVNAFLSNNKEKINKNLLKNYYKPEELDLSKITSTNDLLRKVNKLYLTID